MEQLDVPAGDLVEPLVAERRLQSEPEILLVLVGRALACGHMWEVLTFQECGQCGHGLPGIVLGPGVGPEAYLRLDVLGAFPVIGQRHVREVTQVDILGFCCCVTVSDVPPARDCRGRKSEILKT